jgi:hypothetical protein
MRAKTHPLSFALALLTTLGVGTAVAKPHGTRHGKQQGLHWVSANQPAVELRTTSRFLGANPHVPLAVVKDAEIASVASAGPRKRCGDPELWAKTGSQWLELDAFGQVAGTHRIALAEYYDFTGCTEVHFKRTPRRDATHVFVSADSKWKPAPSLQWKPDSDTERGFSRLLAAVGKGFREEDSADTCTEVANDRLYFTEKGPDKETARRFAVGGRNGGMQISMLDEKLSTWTSVFHEVQQPKSGFPSQCYRPIAVFDMNGDGAPEIIMRFSEGTFWGDVVYGRDASGKWKQLSVSAGGSTG